MSWFRSRSSAVLRVAVVGYDLKFFGGIGRQIAADPAFELRSLETGSLFAFPSEDVAELIAWADVVIGEWFGPRTPDLIGMLRRRQPLIVRLHRFELERGFVDIPEAAQIDRVVCVNDAYAQRVRVSSGTLADRVVVIPNAIDIDRFDRPKSPAAFGTLGMIGVASRRKRLDLGLDILDAVRQRDPTVVLSVKGAAPSDLKWVMDDADERAFFDDLAGRIDDALERGILRWEAEGPDVEDWLSDVGFVLSTSDDESFHLAPAEGMASGAIPVVRRWDGAESVYADRWLFDTVAEAADAVAHYRADEDARKEAERIARSEVARFDVRRVAEDWKALILEAAPATRSRR